MSDHNAPIPPPVRKPHPKARMMQTVAGEWLWAVPCGEAQGASPAGTPYKRPREGSMRDKARPTLRRILPCPNCGQELEPGGNPFSPCIRCGHTNMRIGPEVPIEPDDEGSPASEQDKEPK